MSDSVPVYSSTPEGGIEHKPIIQPMVSRTVRINDPKYGLRTGAARAHEVIERDKERQEWQLQRQEAIARQRAREDEKRQARLRDLDTEIQRLQAAWESDTCSDKVKVKARLLVLLDKREALAKKIAEAAK